MGRHSAECLASTGCYDGLGLGGPGPSPLIGGVFADEVRGDLGLRGEVPRVQRFAQCEQGGIAEAPVEESNTLGNGGVGVVLKIGLQLKRFWVA